MSRSNWRVLVEAAVVGAACLIGAAVAVVVVLPLLVLFAFATAIGAAG